MEGILNDAVKIPFLNYRMADPFWAGVFMGLGTRDFTPDRTSVLADFTEAVFPGYLRQVLAGPWTYGVLAPGGRALSAHAPVTFRNTSGVMSPTIYTFFWYYPLLSYMVMAGRFDVPFSIPSGGSSVRTPFYALIGF